MSGRGRLQRPQALHYHVHLGLFLPTLLRQLPLHVLHRGGHLHHLPTHRLNRRFLLDKLLGDVPLKLPLPPVRLLELRLQVLHSLLLGLISFQQQSLGVVPRLLPVMGDGALGPVLRRLLLLSHVGAKRLNLGARGGGHRGGGRRHVDPIRRSHVVRDGIQPHLQLGQRRAEGVGLLVKRKHLSHDGVELSLPPPRQRVLPLSHEPELPAHALRDRGGSSLRGGDRGGLGAVHRREHRVGSPRSRPRPRGWRTGSGGREGRLDGPRGGGGGDRVQVVGGCGERGGRERGGRERRGGWGFGS